MRDLIYRVIDHPLMCRLFGHRQLYGARLGFCGRCLRYWHA